MLTIDRLKRKNSVKTLRAAALAAGLFGIATSPGQVSALHVGASQPIKPFKAKKRDLSEGNTLFVVPYAHLDTQWRWAYPQVIREFIANTLHQNFALIDKYPNYVFNFSGSRRYEMMREYYPAEYTKLKEYVKAGRWFPCGSSVDENDANVPSGEALIRQVLYGNHFFRKEFGTASHEYMLPDCFGFPYALPSILVHCGIQGFSTQKLTWGSANGIPFKVGTWEGPDGKSIVSALDPGSYGGGVDEDLSENTSWLARIQNTGRLSDAFVDYHYYGTGDRGGAPGASSVDWVEKSIAGKGPITVVSSHADEMFTDLKPDQVAKLPHYKGELLLTAHSAGSISSEAYMKRWNRKNELMADSAERASVAAMWLGNAAYPSQRIYNAWDLVLGSQMHDMLPGTSIPKAYEYCWNDELLAQNQFAAVVTDAVGAVSAAMDTRGKGQAIVVYNPLSIAREDVVEATVPSNPHGDVVIIGSDGKTTATQIIARDAGRYRILFIAKMPPTGFASFDARPSLPAARYMRPLLTSTLRSTDKSIENNRFRIALNKAGDIASIYDKAQKREVLKAPIRLAFQHENPAQFPAWNMDWADAQKPPRAYVGGPAKIRVVESGPVRTTIEVEREADGSKFVQDIRLTAGSDRIEIANKIDWQTKETALKATFPLTTGNPEATYDLQLGAIKRGNDNEKHYEVPQHQWIDLTKPDGSYGVAILNDCKFASNKPNDDQINQTLIYTPGVRGGYGDQATQDFGRHDILLALVPHTGDWRSSNVPWSAKRLNQPLKAFLVPSHPGKLGKTFSLISTNTDQVEIQALKKAEDSSEIVVRLRELKGAAANNIQIRSGAGIVSAREINGQEMPLDAATIHNGTLIASVPAFSLKSFAIKLGSAPTKAAAIESKPVALPFDADVASSDANPADGAFDKSGRAIAAELLPKSLDVDGVQFRFGSTADGAKNAVAAKGQKVQLPARYNRVYLLAASSDGDIPAKFMVGNRVASIVVENWGGYVGQWDNRLWAGNVGANFTNYGEMAGLEPGYVKTAEVAWFGSHPHIPTGNTYYEYTYLFKYGFDIPAGAQSMTLPNDPRIKILAVSVARNSHDQVHAAHPLSDLLADHVATGQPSISPAGGIFHDATLVTIRPPLYYRGGGLHYTTDGSNPNASSPIYSGPITVSDPTTIKAVEIDVAGRWSAATTATLNVHDTTAPKATSVSSIGALGLARVMFSEKVDRRSVEDLSHYDLGAGNAVTGAKLRSDQRGVDLTFIGGKLGTVVVKGIKDLSKSGNAMAAKTMDVVERGALVSQASFEPKTTKVLNVQGLPVKSADTWTLNFFCRMDNQPEDRTMIAGFGRASDGKTGTGRYFTKFPRGINFWISNKDVQTEVQLDTGKWQMLTATYDGTTMRLYKNGEKIAEEQVALEDDTSQARIMPLDAWERQRRFGGEVRDFSIWDQDLPAAAVRKLWESGRADGSGR